MYNLGEMFIGYNDGKKEATYRNDFELYYYDYNRSYEKILHDDKYLLLGKKGTGKSLLAEYINKLSQKQPNWFCKIASYKQFNFHELTHLQSGDVKPNEYIAIWEWIILIELAQLCINDEGIDHEFKDNLKKFITGNFFGIKLDNNKIVEITKTGKINGTFLCKLVGMSGGFSKSLKCEQGTYLDYLEDLRNVVIYALKVSKSEYTILFDELDDKFRNEEIYKSCIISLIKIVDRINCVFYGERIKAKIILLLRSDIFYVLNDPDLNKVEQDNSVRLDWGNTVSSDSPLFKMIFTKIRQSVPTIKGKSDSNLFRELFPQNIYSYPPNQFILGRTYFRPRDLVTYLNLIIEKYPQTRYFGSNGFLELEKEYSKYLLKEVKNELFGHMSEDEISESILLIKQLKKREFDYKEILDFYNSRKRQYKNLDLERNLRFLFDFSIIGNKWYKEGQNKFFYSWAYRENAYIDYDKRFVVHLGLKKALLL